jgi:hypothetical protein
MGLRSSAGFGKGIAGKLFWPIINGEMEFENLLAYRSV